MRLARFDPAARLPALGLQQILAVIEFFRDAPVVQEKHEADKDDDQEEADVCDGGIEISRKARHKVVILFGGAECSFYR